MWLATANWSLGVLLWAIPLGLVIWASQRFIQKEVNGTHVPVIGEISWLLLPPAILIVIAMRQLFQCAEPKPIHRIASVSGAIVIVLLGIDAIDLAQTAVSFIYALERSDAIHYPYTILRGANVIGGAVWMSAIAWAFAGVARMLGLERIGLQLRWWALPLGVLAVFSGLFPIIRDLMTKPMPPWIAGPDPTAGELLASVLKSDSLHRRIATAAVLVMFILVWRAVILARRQVASMCMAREPS